MHSFGARLVSTVKGTRSFSARKNIDSKNVMDLLKKLKSHKDNLTAAKSKPPPSVTPPLPVATDVEKLSSLLDKLEKHTHQEISSKTLPSIKSLFSGLKIDSDRTRPRRLNMYEKSFEGRNETLTSSTTLFLDGQDLGIFTQDTIAEWKTQTPKATSLFERLERETLENALKTQPRNFFEEAVELTKEGKIWKFPINNEQGMEEEAKVSFHEHIFFQPLLKMFPTKGPIRLFMDQVMNGLSKNPHLSVREKHDHILWFAEYFKSKGFL